MARGTVNLGRARRHWSALMKYEIVRPRAHRLSALLLLLFMERNKTLPVQAMPGSIVGGGGGGVPDACCWLSARRRTHARTVRNGLWQGQGSPVRGSFSARFPAGGEVKIFPITQLPSSSVVAFHDSLGMFGMLRCSRASNFSLLPSVTPPTSSSFFQETATTRL